MVQVFLQVEEGVKEYVGHSATLQITQGYLTWRKQHKRIQVKGMMLMEDGRVRLSNEDEGL